MQQGTEGFRRRFGEVLHYQWIYGDGSFDLAERVTGSVGHADELAGSIDHEPGGFRLFRPLSATSAAHDTVLWLERYDDVRAWAAMELTAQHSERWMQMVVAGERTDRSWLGESSVIVEDTLADPRPVPGERIAVDWTVYDPSKLAALVELPALVNELADAMADAGYIDASVRYFAMPTSAGHDLNLAHIWIEHPTPAALGEVLAWRHSAPELNDWRQRFRAAAGPATAAHPLWQVL